jgi:hypothetical protein
MMGTILHILSRPGREAGQEGEDPMKESTLSKITASVAVAKGMAQRALAASPNPQWTEYEMQSVDEWIARQDVKLDRSEAIRRLVELGLKVKKMMAFTINIAESNFRHTQRTSARATVKPATFPEPRFYLDASIRMIAFISTAFHPDPPCRMFSDGGFEANRIAQPRTAVGRPVHVLSDSVRDSVRDLAYGSLTPACGGCVYRKP